MSDFDRRDFFKTAGLTGLALAPQAAAARPLTEKQKLDRIASNTWPLRSPLQEPHRLRPQSATPPTP